MMKFIFMGLSMLILIKLLNVNMLSLIFQNYFFFMSFILILNYNMNNFYWTKINLFLGMDNISFSLIFLTLWIIGSAIMASNFTLKKKFNMNFMIWMILLSIILILCFLSMNLFMFYIFFESSLIPILMMIMGWGNQIDRIQASMYMMFYTLFGSLPLLNMIIYLMKNFNTLMMNILMMFNNNNLMSLFFYFMMISAFLIKMPMYVTHLWLPKAHVEAPISGSMILAGIMLKLGSYGLIRIMPMFLLMFSKFNVLMISISLMGSIYASLICLNQMDLKIIVAYSSVVHMGILMAGMMTLLNWGFKGAILMMIAHGLCSSSMFCLVNFNYERIHSRSMLINKGLMNISPSLTMWWFLICASNFSAPPSLNLISEMMLFNSLLSWNKIIMILLFILSFFSTCYSIYIYSFSQHGKFNLSTFNFKMNTCQEFLILMIHWIPLNLLFMNLNMFI